jgi:hypothetical protein
LELGKNDGKKGSNYGLLIDVATVVINSVSSDSSYSSFGGGPNIWRQQLQLVNPVINISRTDLGSCSKARETSN